MTTAEQDADATATNTDTRPIDADARPTGLRLARLHLRMGALGLARAELEAFAGRGTLDEAALLDLAEVRWRTGDLAGAGEAAGTLLERGHEDVLALVIAAEAIAHEGRPGEARRLAGRALALLDGPLDSLFAGIPRSGVWPEEAPSAAGPSESGAAVAARSGRAGHSIHATHAGHIAIPGTTDPDAPATTAAAEAFAGGRAALGGGDLHAAALRLGVALRLEPAFAEAVLDAIGDRAVDPGLALFAGDALRLLGREAEALAAFDRARGHPAADAPGTAATTGITGETGNAGATGSPPEA
ncbi:MAG: hypothetical protein A2V85_16120 [Chloroflexi bacterium RBG_16_72_14]|nr:MAG: hypothetical protein A2V85_16120 [Chloroflexi bacterium RBG_16_72_14]